MTIIKQFFFSSPVPRQTLPTAEQAVSVYQSRPHLIVNDEHFTDPCDDRLSGSQVRHQSPTRFPP